MAEPSSLEAAVRAVRQAQAQGSAVMTSQWSSALVDQLRPLAEQSQDVHSILVSHGWCDDRAQFAGPPDRSQLLAELQACLNATTGHREERPDLLYGGPPTQEAGRRPDDARFREQYLLQEKLGEGAYGTVYKGIDLRTRAVVAVKRVKAEPGAGDEGVPCTALREVAVLKHLRHPNVVQLLDVCCSVGKLELIFEFVPLNLKQHMRTYGTPREGSGGRAAILEPTAIQSLMHQLLQGLNFCHTLRIVHRDLKPQNLLIDRSRAGGWGLLKIADFGMARAFCMPLPRYTHEVVTTWYRAPEILFGTKEYSLPVDAWSSGCILGELAAGSALFQGDSEIDTIFKIFMKLGTPTEEQWPNLRQLPDFKTTFPKWPRKSWEEIHGAARQLGPAGVQLLDGLLTYDPLRRLSAAAALACNYFEGAQPMDAEPTA